MSRRSAATTLIVTLLAVFGLLFVTQSTNTTPVLGLDLQGGFSVVLDAPEGTPPDVLEQAVSIMRRRIEALGNVQEPEIAIIGDRAVEVQLPGVTDRDRALAAVGTTGLLEFRPVLEISPLPGTSPLFLNQPPTDTTTTTTTPGDSSTTTTEGDVIIDDDNGDTTTTTAAGDTTTTTAAGDTTTTTGDTIPVTTVPGDSSTTTDADTTTTTAGDTTTTAAGDTTTTTAAGDTTTTTSGDPKEGVVLPAGVTWCDEVDQPGCVDVTTGLTPNPSPELDAYLADASGIVYHLSVARVIGADLDGAQAQFSPSSSGGAAGSWIVQLDFNSEGAAKFTQTTKELAAFPTGDPRRQFAIVLDNIIQSAPQIAQDVDPATGITGDTAVITLGSSTDQEKEANDLAVVLKYGALPVAFTQASVQSVSATLGSDSLRAGLVAGIGGLILVALAMILYYRALGLINVIGLLVFGSTVLVIFSLLGAWSGVTLTLAGVAGVIVSVGITADSYIVYFERIKEEVHKGRSLRAAIDHGFSRAFHTLITADTVSFMAAVLLFFLAAGSVKGFALALGIATVTDVLVAVFYTRPAVALVAHTKFGEGGRFSIRGATGAPGEVAK